jgi:hypothetical protein
MRYRAISALRCDVALSTIDSLFITEKESHMKLRNPIFTFTRAGIAAIAFAATLPTAHASSLSEASRASLNASVAVPVTLVQGTAQMFKDAGRFSITGVKTVGEVSTVTLRGLANGAEASVQFTGKAIEGSAIAVGTVLQGSVTATGVILVGAGKALMFVPNEVGAALMHRSRARDY